MQGNFRSSRVNKCIGQLNFDCEAQSSELKDTLFLNMMLSEPLGKSITTLRRPNRDLLPGMHDRQILDTTTAIFLLT